MLEKEDIVLLIQICRDWGFDYGCMSTGEEVEEMQKKLEKMVRYF